MATKHLKLLFYEPEHGGHHFAYLARMLPGFADLPVTIIVATTVEAMGSAEYHKTLEPLAGCGRLEVRAVCRPVRKDRSPIVTALGRVRELKRLVRCFKPDRVYVMYADGIWPILAVLGPLGRIGPKRGAEGWIYRGAFYNSQSLGSIARRFLFRRLLRGRTFAGLHIDHELLMEYAQRHAVSNGAVPILTPNPVAILPSMDRVEARRKLGLPEQGRLVSTSGMIAGWKGADRLVETFGRLARKWIDLQLLLAGPHDKAIKALLNQPPYAAMVKQGRIFSIDRFIDETEMFTVAAASDLVTAVYPNHPGRSSIILWAAAAGRPVVGAEGGCIGHVIRAQKLGLTCDPHDPQSMCVVLEKAMAMEWTTADEHRVRDYAKQHSIENYQTSASALLRKILVS